MTKRAEASPFWTCHRTQCSQDTGPSLNLDNGCNSIRELVTKIRFETELLELNVMAATPNHEIMGVVARLEGDASRFWELIQ